VIRKKKKKVAVAMTDVKTVPPCGAYELLHLTQEYYMHTPNERWLFVYIDVFSTLMLLETLCSSSWL